MRLDFDGWKSIAVRTRSAVEFDPLPNAVLTMVEARALAATKVVELKMEKTPGGGEIAKVRMAAGGRG